MPNKVILLDSCTKVILRAAIRCTRKRGVKLKCQRYARARVMEGRVGEITRSKSTIGFGMRRERKKEGAERGEDVTEGNENPSSKVKLLNLTV